MTVDQIAEIGGSLIHHGAASDRAYLLKLGGDPGEVAEKLEDLAKRRGYSKIIAKVPEGARAPFAEAGYRSEGSVPRYYRGEETVFFMAKYLCPDRRLADDPERVAKVLAAARRRTSDSAPDDSLCRKARPRDAEAMAALYRKVFDTYPFPIHDPDYLRRTMKENIAYFGIWKDGAPIALASAEIDLGAESAEMTDFATDPDHRGGGMATALLFAMEKEMRRRAIPTVYTIARAVSFGMNLTFAKLDYRYGGTLTRNTQISGSLECMNIWYKHLLALSSSRAVCDGERL
jgi:beta-lysine N6-acetyltransferase